MAVSGIEVLFGLIVLAWIVGVVAVVVTALLRPSPVNVADEVDSRREPADLDARAFRALSHIQGVELGLVGSGRYTVVVRRRPIWTVALAFFAFPLGLLALMYTEELRLDVSISSRGESGSGLQVAGRSTKVTAQYVGIALQEAAAGAPTEAGGTR